MPNLESIVRPFQTGDVFVKRRQVPVFEQPVTEPPDDKINVIEGSPETNFLDEGTNWYSGFNSDLKEDKARRESKLVKVVNPDDVDQHVFVERIDKAVFKDGKGKETSLAFDWSSPKDGGA